MNALRKNREHARTRAPGPGADAGGGRPPAAADRRRAEEESEVESDRGRGGEAAGLDFGRALAGVAFRASGERDGGAGPAGADVQGHAPPEPPLEVEAGMAADRVAAHRRARTPVTCTVSYGYSWV